MVEIFTKGISLVVQWLGFYTSNAEGLSLIPGQRTRSLMLQLKILYITM